MIPSSSPLNILIIGSGGREHALATVVAQSPLQPTVFIAPGNPGCATVGACIPIESTDVASLVVFAQSQDIDFTIVGPEAPLALGVVDAFQQAGLRIFGPTQANARLESSKAYAKRIMQQAGVPTANYHECSTLAEAETALHAMGQAPYVIKEDGLAAGKGVTIAPTLAEALEACQRAFAKASPVVIEAFLQGEELSVLAVCDGTQAVALCAAQDFKRVGDNHTGPNTGGMGAYAPVAWFTPTLQKEVQQRVLQPMLATLAENGTPYTGVLYAGLMISPTGELNVIEFNARFGDPETQVVLPLTQQRTDVLTLLMHAEAGTLTDLLIDDPTLASDLQRPRQQAVTVVLACYGYPEHPRTGDEVILPTADVLAQHHATVFHAGTRFNPTTQQLESAGGRVLSITAVAESLHHARQQAYTCMKQVTLEGGHTRSDIAETAAKLQETSLAY